MSMPKKSTTIFFLVIITTSVAASSFISCTSRSNNTHGDISAVTSQKEITVEDTGGGVDFAPTTVTAVAETITACQQKTIPSATKSSKMKSSVKKKKTKNNNNNNIVRWAIHGVATELFHNIVLRMFHQLRLRLSSREGQRRLDMEKLQRNMREPSKHEIAIVTGATGGIGSRIAHELAVRGYDVVIAARDLVRGEALAAEIRGLVKVMPICDSQQSTSCTDDNDMPTITFVEYHADVPQSAMSVASYVKELGSPISILINNAGIMGQSKRLTMMVNLLGPVYLTLALIPLMAAGEKRAAPSTVINVGSSAHLRATHVLDDEWLASGESNNKQSWIDSIPDASDSDLTTYAKSKLALMQFSTIVRHCLPTCDSPIRIFDAHPGLVWTSLLRNHIGDRAVRMLTSTGLANIIYKSSSEGAHAIVSALDYAPSSSARVADEKEQMYFVNGMPDGFASPESASFHASLLLWKYVLKPELEGVVEMNDEWTSMKQMIEAMEKQIDM